MPVEHGSRPQPIGRPNFAPDGVGGSSGKLPVQGARPVGEIIPVRELQRRTGSVRSEQRPGNNPFTLLPGATPLGEPIVRARRLSGERRHTESIQPSLRQEINAYLDERARLRAAGQLPRPEDKPPIITPADAMTIDLSYLLFSLRKPQTDEQREKYNSIDRIAWAFDALAFGLMSQRMQEDVTIGYEFTQGFNRNRPNALEKKGRLNGEETAMLAEQLQKVGLPFQAQPQGITIPFGPTVKKMREIAGREPLWKIPPPNLTHINNRPRRNR